MDELSTKAIIIGISIFVTLVITTVVIAEFFQIKQIYKTVGETNVSFESNFNELDKFNDANNEFNGLDVKNCVKKFIDDPTTDVCIEDRCNDEIDLLGIVYSDEYKARLEETTKGYKIIFSIR